VSGILGSLKADIEDLARFRLLKKFLNGLQVRFFLGKRRCLPPGDIDPPSFRTCRGTYLDRLEYHFLAVCLRLRLFTADVFIFVGGYGRGCHLRRNVSGKLK
jgi:hypothetical protein